MSTQLLVTLNGQEKLLRDQNIQREIALKLENLKLGAAIQDQSNLLLAEQIKLEEQGLNSSEVKIKLLLKETELQFDALDAMAQAGILEKEQANALQKSLGQLTLKRIEAEKLAKVQADLEATRPERAVGGAVIEGAQALFSGEFYSKIYDSLVSGGNYLLEGINKIEWSDLGTQIGDGLKNIDWDNLGDLFKGGMSDLSGSGLFQGIASAAGPSGQRALSIAQAGAAGGPVAALGAAILSNEKVQQALSKLFDAVFKFIDPFLDLLGPVIDIFTAFLENNPIMTAVNALKPFLESLGNAISGLARAVASLDLGSKGGTLGYIFGGGLGSDIEEGFNKIANLVGLGYQSGKRDFIAGDTVIDYQKSVLDPIFEDIDYVFEHGFRRFSSDPSVRGLIDQNFDQFSLTAEAAESFLKEVDRIGFDEALEESLSSVSAAFDQIANLYIHGYDKDKVSRNAAAVKEELTRLLEETYFGGLLAEFIEGIDSEIESINDNIKSRDFFNFYEILNSLGQEVEDLALPNGMFDKAIEKINEFSEAFKNYSNILAEEQIQEISLRGYDLTDEQEIEIKYYDEMLEVRRNTNLTLADQKRIIDELVKARDREIDALEREQTILNLRNAQSSLSEILSIFEKTMEGIQDLITSLFDQVRDLLFSEFNLDPAFKKMEGAAIIYGDLLEKALDSEATIEDIERLQGFVNTYLSSARDLYKSSSTFQEIFNQVLNDLNEIGITAPANLGLNAISLAELDLDELAETIDVSLEPLLDELNRMKNALAKQLTDFENFKLNADIQAGIEIVDDQGNPITNLIKSIGADLILVGSDGVTEISEVIAYANGRLELIDEQNNVVNTIEVSATGVPVLKDANGNVTGNLEFNAQGELVIVDASGNEIGAIRKEIAAEVAILDKNGNPVTELLPAIELGDVKIVDQYNNEVGKIIKTIEGEILVVDNNNNPLQSLVAQLPGNIRLTQNGRIVDTLTTTATGQIVLTNSKSGDVYLIDAGNVTATVGISNPYPHAGNVTATVGINNPYPHAGNVTASVGLNTGNLTWGYEAGIGWGWTKNVGSVTATATLSNSTAPAGSVYGSASLSNPYEYVTNVGWRYVHNAGSVYVSGDVSADFNPYYFNQEVQNTQNEINNKLNSFSLSSYNVTGKIQTLQNEINNAIANFSLNSFSAGGGGGSGSSQTGLQLLKSAGNQGSGATGSATNPYFTDYGSGNYRAYYYESGRGASNVTQGFAAAAIKLEQQYPNIKTNSSYVVTVDTSGWNYLWSWTDKSAAQENYDSYVGWYGADYVKKYGFQQGGLVPGPMDTIPAMLAPGEYIMSRGAVDSLGIGTLNSLNAGDLSALRQTGDPEVRSLLRELIIAVKTSDTEVNVYTDMRGEAKAAIGEFRTELRERSRRQGEKYVNVRYV